VANEFLMYLAAYSLLGIVFYAVGLSIYRAGPRRRLWRSAWQFRFRSLFGSALQRRDRGGGTRQRMERPADAGAPRRPHAWRRPALRARPA
jgi:hypothetical protein